MSKSIEFVHEKSEAIEILSSALKKLKIKVEQVSDIQFGKKFFCENNMVLVLYFKKGLSSKIVVEKGNFDNDLEKLLATNPKNSVKKTHAKQSKRQVLDIPEFDSHIGTDESGKGDFFGPLVVAGVFVTKDDEQELLKLGVKDSKQNSDKKNLELAKKIAAYLGEKKFSIVFIRPEKYNSLYTEMGRNLNKILGWGHARAIENILKFQTCENAIADQFGDISVIQNALMKEGRKLNLIQTPKAERDVAVASASILARAKFLHELEKISNEIGMKAPKGVSPSVEEVARKIIKNNNGKKEVLNKFVKLHFKTTKKVVE